MSSTRKHFGVFIGRFQPFHSGHFHVVKEALKKVDTLIIILGSHEKAQDHKNPFSTSQRIEIIQSALTPEMQERVRFNFVHDYMYSNEKWISEVQSAVFTSIHRGNFIPDSYDVSLVGHSKDASSFYLKMFPSWDSIEVDNYMWYSATDIREYFYQIPWKLNRGANLTGHSIMNYFVSKGHFETFTSLLRGSISHFTDEIQTIQKEYKEPWEDAPYPPVFVTTDAVVVSGGNILTIRRKNHPGRGTIALPGGYLNIHESLEDCMIRELREETRIKVPERVLRGSIKNQKVYDNPSRDLRGRIITHAFYIELEHFSSYDDPYKIKLPKIQGADDAEKAEWMPLSLFKKNRNMVYADHFDIVSDLLGI